MKRAGRLARWCARLLLAAAIPLPAPADQGTASGNAGTIDASAQLDFEINIGKFVLLRVGAADASVTDVEFRVEVVPPLADGNSQPDTGPVRPALATSASTTNPATGAGSVDVAAFTNMAGTVITCTLSPLAGAVAFAAGGTTAGVPGRSNIRVAATGVNHPGPSLNTCNGTRTAAVPRLTNLVGSYTYSTSFNARNLRAGLYGNVVTYTITAP